MTGRRSHGRLSALNGVVHQGSDFAPGFDPDNYLIVDGSFASQNVFLDPDLQSPLTKEFTVSGGGALGTRGHLMATYIRRRAGHFTEDFLDLSSGSTEIMHESRSYGTFVNEVFRNTDALERNYDALQFDGSYRVTSRFQLDGSYTVQLRNEGNFEGEATQDFWSRAPGMWQHPKTFGRAHRACAPGGQYRTDQLRHRLAPLIRHGVLVDRRRRARPARSESAPSARCCGSCPPPGRPRSPPRPDS